MWRIRAALVLAVLFTFVLLVRVGWPEVVPPSQIADPESRELQEKYRKELTALGEDLDAQRFPYHFYFSRSLDIDEKRQRHADQRSIRFGRIEGHVALEITGNYYAAYSLKLMNRDQRAGQTFHDVVLPLLRVAVQQFQANPDVEGYAMEISHHVLGKVWGITIENPENLFVLLPQSSARRLLAAEDESEQRAALSEATVLLDGEPVALALGGATPPHS
jgi:hypothetical protein